MTRPMLPSPEQINPNTPLRLSVAAALAFPDGSMTPSGLRREGARGRLVVERIAGKDYTTLANIERMTDLLLDEVAEGLVSKRRCNRAASCSRIAPCDLRSETADTRAVRNGRQ
jgi:hypothetical protein